jgi:hypothetical protein
MCTQTFRHLSPQITIAGDRSAPEHFSTNIKGPRMSISLRRCGDDCDSPSSGTSGIDRGARPAGCRPFPCLLFKNLRHSFVAILNLKAWSESPLRSGDLMCCRFPVRFTKKWRSESMLDLSRRQFHKVMVFATLCLTASTAMLVNALYAQSSGWGCIAGGASSCVADTFGKVCTDVVSRSTCNGCITKCPADTFPTKACGGGSTPGTCIALSRGCNSNLTTTWKPCVRVLCLCAINTFDGPCEGKSTNGSYQYGCSSI